MIVLLLTIVASIQATKEKLNKQSLNNKDQLKELKNFQNISLLVGEIDYLGCYAAYLKAVASIGALTAAKQVLPEIKDAASDAAFADLVAFKSQCAATAIVSAYDTAIGSLTAVVKGDETKLTTHCKVNPPGADAADCYTAYAALIASLDKPATKKQHIPEFKDIASDYLNYKNKCPTTVNTKACYDILIVIDKTIPEKKDIDDIKDKCSVNAPTETKKDGAMLTSITSSGLILLTLAITRIYFFL
jgi:hypothetical protein